MAELVIETPEGVPLRLELAGPGARLLAASIDGLLFAAGYFVIGVALVLGGLDEIAYVLAAGAIVSLVAYSFLFSWRLDGRTPGKLWAGIRVCDRAGFSAGPGRLFLRALFVPLEVLLLVPVPLVWILIALTPLRQRLGDLVAGTLVLRERAPRAPREPAPGLLWSELEAREFALSPAEVRALSAADLAFLRDLLTRPDLERSAGERLLPRAAAHFAPRVGCGSRAFSVEEARVFLRELFLCLRELRSREPRYDSSGGGERSEPR